MKAHWLEEERSGEPIAAATLGDEGVPYRRLPIEPGAYQPELDQLMRANGYLEQDQVELSPETPDLEALCAKFVDEHRHDEDEVRFVLAGEGVFDIRARDDRWMRILVEQGDLIVVPRDRFHRFFLTDKKSIRCVRLFQDRAGWVPHYRARRA